MRAMRGFCLNIALALLAAAIFLPGACKKEAGQAAKPAAGMAAGQKAAAPEVKTGYAPVDGLSMYYEIHGSGKPLVLVHGAFMAIPAWGDVLTELAKARRVIAVELQGHGRTADIDRPFTYEQFADDVAALMRYLAIDKADVMGYSLGGGVALQTAIRHPEIVDRLVVASAAFRTDGWHKEIMANIAEMKPEFFDGTPIRMGYDNLAPRPEFPQLVEKIKALEAKVYKWPEADIRGIASPVLVVIGDSDAVPPEHAAELFRLLGGGVPGDLGPMPKSQLAILPGTNHVAVAFRTAWLVPMVADFLDGKAFQFPM